MASALSTNCVCLNAFVWTIPSVDVKWSWFSISGNDNTVLWKNSALSFKNYPVPTLRDTKDMITQPTLWRRLLKNRCLESTRAKEETVTGGDKKNRIRSNPSCIPHRWKICKHRQVKNQGQIRGNHQLFEKSCNNQLCWKAAGPCYSWLFGKREMRVTHRKLLVNVTTVF